MIKRLKTALFAPKEIINLRMDSFGRVFLYVLILAICLMLPATIEVASFKSFDYSQRAEAQKAFAGKSVPYNIVNYKLVQNDTIDCCDYIVSEEFTISIGTLPTTTCETRLRLLFGTESVYLCGYIGGNEYLKVELFAYNKYEELQNVNLSLASADTNYDFWNMIFNVASKEAKSYIPFVSIGTALAYLVVNTGVIFLLALVLAVFQRLGIKRIIPFKESFTMACYALTIFAVGGLLSELFRVELIYYIGMFLSVVYNMIASNTLFLNKYNK